MVRVKDKDNRDGHYLGQRIKAVTNQYGSKGSDAHRLFMLRADDMAQTLT